MKFVIELGFFVTLWTLYVSKIDAGKKGGGSNIVITGGGGGGCDGWGGCGGSGSLILSTGGWGKKGKKGGGDNIVIHGSGGGCCHKKHVDWHPSHWHHHQHHHGGGGWGDDKKTEIKIKPIIIPMKIPMPMPIMSWGGGHMSGGHMSGGHMSSGGGGGWGEIMDKIDFHKPTKMHMMDDWSIGKHPVMGHFEHDKGWSSSWMMEGLDHWGDDGW